MDVLENMQEVHTRELAEILTYRGLHYAYSFLTRGLL